MATFEVQGGRGHRRAVDTQIPLVPFIDLLLCCVMFLLVTAVWNQLASQDAKLQGSTADAVPSTETVRLTLIVKNDGYALTSGVGSQVDIAGHDGVPNAAMLEPSLRAQRKAFPATEALWVTAEDGVAYRHVIQAMDVARQVGFESLLMGGS